MDFLLVPVSFRFAATGPIWVTRPPIHTMASIRHLRLPVKPQNAAVRQKSASGTSAVPGVPPVLKFRRRGRYFFNLYAQ